MVGIGAVKRSAWILVRITAANYRNEENVSEEQERDGVGVELGNYNYHRLVWCEELGAYWEGETAKGCGWRPGRRADVNWMNVKNGMEEQ